MAFRGIFQSVRDAPTAGVDPGCFQAKGPPPPARLREKTAGAIFTPCGHPRSRGLHPAASLNSFERAIAVRRRW